MTKFIRSSNILPIVIVVGSTGLIASTCIIPDKDIQVIAPCGTQWCITIPSSGDGQAWGDQAGGVGGDVVVKEIVDSEIVSIKRCVCMTPSESEVLDEGCPSMPCDPEFIELRARVTNAVFEACLNAAIEHFSPDLSQNPAFVDDPHKTCLEASAFWGDPVESAEECVVPIDECDTEVAAMGDGGEPYYTLMTACTSGTCTVPDDVLDAIEANPDLLMDSNTRLTQVSSGMQFSGILQNSLAYRLGFRNSDTLQEVNGNPFRTTSDFLRVFQDLRSTDAATVQVLRSGNVINLDFQREQPWP